MRRLATHVLASFYLCAAIAASIHAAVVPGTCRAA